MIGKKVIVDDEVFTVLKEATAGYMARLERTGEILYIADVQIKKVLN